MFLQRLFAENLDVFLHVERLASCCRSKTASQVSAYQLRTYKLTRCNCSLLPITLLRKPYWMFEKPIVVERLIFGIDLT
jgi:hypothetical protein